MATPPNTLGSLTQSAQLQNLKGAKGILWLVGILTILFQGFQFSNSGKEYDEALTKELGKQQTSLAVIQRDLPETMALLEKEREETVSKLHLIYGGGVGLGVLFVACALMVNKKPVIATVTGLVLYLGSIAAMAMMDPASLGKGIIVKVLFVAGLAKSAQAAIAYEKERRATPVA